MSTKSTGPKLSEGVPEELFDLVRNALNEETLVFEAGRGLQSSKILLSRAEFLFEVSRF